jgi:sugar fermentation stimulation protein A
LEIRVEFETPLIEGKFLRRYKRFFADIDLPDLGMVTVHTPNTGSLKGCLVPDGPAAVMRASNPNRKLAYTLELLRVGPTWIGVNPARANALVEESIRVGWLEELAGYATIKREVRYGEASRIDLLLESPGKPPCYVEVKSVTLAESGGALFPDAVSTRAAKHMGELARQVARGDGACVVFAVQREDCDTFAPADAIDPAYGRALREAHAAGVQVLAYRAEIALSGIRLRHALPVLL